MSSNKFHSNEEEKEERMMENIIDEYDINLRTCDTIDNENINKLNMKRKNDICNIKTNETDDKIVDELEKDRRTVRNFFTFQFTENAIKHRFGHGDVGKKLISEFVRMLCFDTITGNNDRHTYNWGIVCDLSGKRAPCFSPVYDSARGLFWNEHEQRLARFKEKQKDGTTNLEKYIQDSMPRIGWEGVQDPNHFDLSRLIYQNRPEYRYIFDEMLLPERENALNELLENDFRKLFSLTRYDLIKKCLNLRFQKINSIINQIKKEERT